MTAVFAGGNVVITGGDGALGSAVVSAFVGAGAVCHLPLFGPARPEPPPAGVWQTAKVDLTDEEAVEQYYRGLPPLAASVHLAGGYRATPIAETSRKDFEQMLLMNLATTFLCCREAIIALRKSGGGRIVNVGARVSEVPIGGAAAYSVSKAGVAALTRSLAVEVKPDGILVNAVLPSIIDTPANRAAMPTADHDRWPKPEEVASTILWLASPDNQLTSGALIPVYGLA